MKKFSFLVMLLGILSCAQLWARTQQAVSGRVVNAKGEGISYATVVAMQEGVQRDGSTTDDKGYFLLKLSAGEYDLSVDYVGYKTLSRKITVSADGDLGVLTLEESTTQIGEVVVQANMIRREADRFVVDVVNSASTIGRTGEELLRQSPGVWLKDDEISINGASGARLFINDRELKLSVEDQVRYLKALRAEDISKIEIIPQTGADHDADSSAGIIKIWLRRRLENGVMGSVSMYSNQNFSGLGWDYDPSASINAHVGKFDLSASGWYSHYKYVFDVDEQTTYHNSNSALKSATELPNVGDSGGVNLSAFAEINPRHSVALSLGYNTNNDIQPTDSWTKMITPNGEVLSDSFYDASSLRDTYSSTLNYIFKTDDQGSNLKFIGEYTQRDSKSDNENFTERHEFGVKSDSTYFNRNNSFFRVATASLAREKVLGKAAVLKYGAKYTYNEINADAMYRYLKGSAWVPSTVSDYDISYTENIAAAYATATLRKGRFSAVVGLRGEYTYTDGKDSDVGQEYFSLFPNANFSFALDKQGRHSLVAQYSRSISRPSFWNLTPNRMQISDYTYQTGNPLLDPAYVNTYSLTGVIAQKYSVTLVVMSQKDAIKQMIVADEFDPQMLNLTHVNMPILHQYIATMSLPVTLAKWWTWNTNLIGGIQEQMLTPSSAKEYNSFAQWSSSMTFTLPKEFFVDVDYSGFTNVVESNVEVKAKQSLSLTVKKRIKKAWTLSCMLNELVPRKTKLVFGDEDFTRMLHQYGFNENFRMRLGVTWNFQSGKQFRARTVEKTEGESRM